MTHVISTPVVEDFLPTATSMRRLAAIAAAGPVLLATAYILTELLPVSPLWNAATRILPAGLLLLAVHPRLPSGPWWWRSLVLGGLNFGAFFALQAFSLHRLSGGVVATIAAMQTVLVPLGAAAMLGERPRLSQLTAAGTGVLGIALLVLRGTGDLNATGVAAATMLALCSASGMLLTRRWGLPHGVHYITTTAWQMLSGAILLLPVAFALEGTPPAMTATGWSVTAWLAVAATAVAFAALFGALHRGLPTTSVSRLMLLCPLVATAAGWVVYRQTLTSLQLVGAALVLLSVAAACSRPPVSTPAPRATDNIRIPAPRGAATTSKPHPVQRSHQARRTK